jgi:hypothetical protein
MGSITLPQAATHAPALAPPERRARAHGEPQRERFAPLWLRISLTLATIVTLALLYPRSYIEGSLRRAPPPNAATLAYLRLMVMAQPAAVDTRMLLAQQALTAGDLSLSRDALAPWTHRPMAALPLGIALLELRLLRVELSAQPASSPRHARLAAAYARSLLLLAPRMGTPVLLRQARFAAVLGRYRTAVSLYRYLIRRSGNAAVRAAAFRAGIDALRAAGRPRDALTFARDELAAVPPSPALWRLMTRLALMADAPRLAAHYARRLVGLGRS